MAAPSTEGHINQTGITVVWDSPDSALDVVFVHGLDGHPYETWTASGPKAVFWPRDLLPETLESQPARILTYGYEATIFSLTDDGAEDGLLQHGEALAYELTINRKLKNRIRKPIVFVCHSLGGLIVRAALLACAKAMENGHMRALYVSTHGVIFLATPHFGPTTAARGGIVLQSIANSTSRSLVLTSSRDLASTLQTRSKALERLDEEFKEHLQNLQAACFYETRPTEVLGTKKLIVDVISAAPPYVISQCDVAGIPANHQDICRFSSKSDPGYEQVADTILQFSQDSMDYVTAKWRVFFHHNAGAEFDECEPKPVDSPTLMSKTLLFFGPLDPYFRRTLFGRADELAELREHLLDGEGRPKATASVLIYSDAGFGKSRLARQFIYQSSQAYVTGVFWFNARSIVTCKESYLALAEELLENKHAQLSEVDSREPDCLINMARSWLESQDDWLMVFDGIAFGDRSIRAFKQLLPMSRRSSIIYTSHDQSLCKRTTLFEPLGINAGPLDKDSAVCLLYHELHIDNPTKDQNSKASKLVDRYNCQPLAIRTVSCLLNTSGVSLEDFEFPSEPSPSIDELYCRLYERLQDQPQPLMLMNILSFFDNRVPLQMIHLAAPFLGRFTHSLEAAHREKNMTSESMAQTIDALVQHGLAESSYSTYLFQNGQDASQDQLDDTSSADFQSPEKGGSSGRVDYLEVFPTAQSYFRARLSEKRGESEWWFGLAAMMLIYTYRNAFRDQQEEKTSKPYLRPIRDFRQFTAHARRLVDHSINSSTDVSKLLEKLLREFLASIDRETKKREEAEIAAAVSLDDDSTADKVIRSVFHIEEGRVTGSVRGEDVARDVLDIQWPEQPTDMALVAPPEALKTLVAALSDHKDEQAPAPAPAPEPEPESEEASQQSNLDESGATDTPNAQSTKASAKSPPRRSPTPPQPSSDIPDNLIEWSDEEDDAHLPAFQVVEGKKRHKAPGHATESKGEDSPGAKAADGKSKFQLRVQSGEKGERKPQKWSKTIESVAWRKPISKDEPKTTSEIRVGNLTAVRKHSRQPSSSSWAKIASTTITTRGAVEVPDPPTASGPAMTEADPNKPPANVDNGSEQVEAQQRSLVSSTASTNVTNRDLDVQAVNKSIDHRRKVAWSESTEDSCEFPPLGSKSQSQEPEPVRKVPTESDSQSKEPKSVWKVPIENKSHIKEPEPVRKVPTESESQSKEPKSVWKVPTENKSHIKEPEPVWKVPTESESHSKEPKSVWKIPTESTEAPHADEAEFPSLGSQTEPKTVPGSKTPTKESTDNAAGDVKTDIPPAGDAVQHKEVPISDSPGNKSASRITTYAKVEFPPLVSEVGTKAKKVVLRPRDSASSENTSAWSAVNPRGQHESTASSQSQPLNRWVDVLKNGPKTPKDEAPAQTTAQQTEAPTKSWADALKTDKAPAQKTSHEANRPPSNPQDRKEAPLQTRPSKSWADALKEDSRRLDEIIAKRKALASIKREASGPPPDNRMDASKRTMSKSGEGNNQLATKEIPEQANTGLFQSMSFSTSGNWADMMDEEEEFFSNKEASRADDKESSQNTSQQGRLTPRLAGTASLGGMKVRENDAPSTQAKPPSGSGSPVQDTPPNQMLASHETPLEEKKNDLAVPKQDLPAHADEVAKPSTSTKPEVPRQKSMSWADMMDEEDEAVVPPQPSASKDTRDQKPSGERIDSTPSQRWPDKPAPLSHGSSQNPEEKLNVPWRRIMLVPETSETHKPTKPAPLEKSPPQKIPPSTEQSPRQTGDAEQAPEPPSPKVEANEEQSSQQTGDGEKTTSAAKVTKGPIARLLAEDQNVQSRDSSSDRTDTTTAITPPTPITEPDVTPEKSKSPPPHAPRPKSGLSKQISANPSTGTRGPMPGIGRGMIMRPDGEVSTLDLSDGRQVSGELPPNSEQETPHREAPSTDQAKGQDSQESRHDGPDSQGPANQQQSASQHAEDPPNLKEKFMKFLKSGKEPELPTIATCPQLANAAEANVLPQAPFATPEHSTNPVLPTVFVPQQDNQVIDAGLASKVPPSITPGWAAQGYAPYVPPVEQLRPQFDVHGLGPQNAEGINLDEVKDTYREGDSRTLPSNPAKAPPILRLVFPPAAETDQKIHDAEPVTDQQLPGKVSIPPSGTRGPPGSNQRANPPSRNFSKGAGRGFMQSAKPTYEPHPPRIEPTRLGGPRDMREPSHQTGRPQIPQPHGHLHSATFQQRIIPRTLTCAEIEEGSRPSTQQDGNRQRQEQLTTTAQQAPKPVSSRPGEPLVVSDDVWVRGLLTGDHSISRHDEGLKKKVEKEKEEHRKPSTRDQACQTEPIFPEKTQGPAIEHLKKKGKEKHHEPSTKDQMCQTEPILLKKAKGPAIEHKDKNHKRERKPVTPSPEFGASISPVEHSEASSGFERFHTPVEYPGSMASADGPSMKSTGKGVGMLATREGEVQSKLPKRTVPKKRLSSPHSRSQESASSPNIVEKLKRAVATPMPHDSFEPGPSAIGGGGAPANFNEAVAFLDQEARGRKCRKTSGPKSSVAVAASTSQGESQLEDRASVEHDMRSSQREMIQVWIDRIRSPRRYTPESVESNGPTREEETISPLSGFKSGGAMTGFSQSSDAPTKPRQPTPTPSHRPIVEPPRPGPGLPSSSMHMTSDGRRFMMVAVPIPDSSPADRGYLLPSPLLPSPMTPSPRSNQPPARNYGIQGHDHPYMYHPTLQRPDVHPIAPWPDQIAPLRVTHTPPQYEAHPPAIYDPWAIPQPQPMYRNTSSGQHRHPRNPSGEDRPPRNRNKPRNSSREGRPPKSRNVTRRQRRDRR